MGRCLSSGISEFYRANDATSATNQLLICSCHPVSSVSSFREACSVLSIVVSRASQALTLRWC
jgi:hypothetical protein